MIWRVLELVIDEGLECGLCRVGTYHSWQNTLQDGSKDVEDIAQQPDDDELDRESIGASALEVLDDLRRKDNDCARALAEDVAKGGTGE